MITRRELFRAAGAAALVQALPPIAAGIGAEAPPLVSSFAFTAAERATLRAAANQLIPPFRNDRLTFAGAGEEGAVEYIEQLLSAFDFDPPRIYPSMGTGQHLPGSPTRHDQGFTECEGGHLAVPDGWLPLPAEKDVGWRAAIARFQQGYRTGLALLDEDSRALFQSGFVDLPAAVLQTVLLERYDGLNAVERIGGVYTAGGGEAALAPTFAPPADPRAYFFNLLVTHVMEAIYGDPIYGGNKNRIGWKLTSFGGPHHPEGYLREELETVAPCNRGLPLNLDLGKNLL
jgi:gluconate 2-dehydrogenase subunit 3-like protein